MPKAYWITFYREIKNPEKLAAYAKLAAPATAKFGSKYLAAAPPPPPTRPGRKTASSSPSSRALAQAIAAHDSPGYQEALKVLGDGAVRDVRMVEGLE